MGTALQYNNQQLERSRTTACLGHTERYIKATAVTFAYFQTHGGEIEKRQ